MTEQTGPTARRKVAEAVASATASASSVESKRALMRIQTATRTARVWNVILDDDPTGTQTVRDVPVLAACCSELDLVWAAHHPGHTTFILTNTRSMDERSAYELTYKTVCRAAQVAKRLGRRLRITTRSDSTLRGHFAAETQAAHCALRETGLRSDGTIFVPAFLEAGRVTVHNVQWVRDSDTYVPAAHTEFAQDATFGYDELNLRRWVEVRVGASPTSISLAELRQRDGVAQVEAHLRLLTPDEVVVVNAAAPMDLEVLMLGLFAHEEHGHRPIIRCAPSFVRLLAAQHAPPPLDDFRSNRGTGLVAVGSHTALTTAQLEKARADHRLRCVELDVAKVVHRGSVMEAEVQRTTAAVMSALETDDVAVYTSRALVTEGQATPLLTSRAVADALTEVVRRVAETHELSFLVAKGGITSSDMFHNALGASRARVLGQMFPGIIPVWELVDGMSPGLPYVVFPGNIGAPTSLGELLDKLRGRRA